MGRNEKDNTLLMTVLAKGATGESRKLLRKHGRPDAKNETDLAKRLAELYFDEGTNQIELEKEMVEIHPHTKWILKHSKTQEKDIPLVQPVIQPPMTKEEIQKLVSDGVAAEKKTGFDGFERSQFAGLNMGYPQQTQSNQIVEMVALVVIAGLALHFLKQHK